MKNKLALVVLQIVLSIPLYAFAQGQAKVSLDLSDLTNRILSSKMIVFAEDHKDIQSKMYYQALIAEIQRIDPEYNCLSLEFVSDMNDRFQQVSSEADYKVFIREYLSTVPFYKAQWDSLAADAKEKALDKFYTRFLGWYQAAEYMKASGGKAYLTDDFTIDSVSPRSRAMVNAMKKNIENGNCKKFITVNGNGHVAEYFGKTLSQYMLPYETLGLLFYSVPADATNVVINLQERTRK